MGKVRMVAALTVLAALAAGCGGSDGDAAGGGGGDINIGAWYPLSGPQASSGTPQQVGASVFFKKFNADGGVNGTKVDFITKDNAFDPQQTIQIAREMVARDKVDAIVATNGTATTEATFPYVLDQSKVPIFGTYGGDAGLQEARTTRSMSPSSVPESRESREGLSVAIASMTSSALLPQRR